MTVSGEPDYEKQVDLNSNFRSTKASDLEDGTYLGRVENAWIKEVSSPVTPSGKQKVFEINLVVDGRSVQISYWLASDANMKRCLINLQKIGFDVPQWGPMFDRPYLVEMDKAGLAMRGKTLSFRRDTNGQYKNVTLMALSADSIPSQPSEDDLPF
jgi:hypothetical protein